MEAGQKDDVLIAGAGCAGLATGIALLKRGHKVTILEVLDRVGGLAGGIEFRGNTYEYGPHIFHTTDPEVLEDVKRIAGHVLIPFERSIKIKFLGKYFDYPLTVRDMLTKLPVLTIIRAGFSFVRYFISGLLEGEKGLINSEKVLRRYYGDVLYRIFFRDYIIKVWGITPAQMAPSFAQQRIPNFGIFDFLEKIKKKFLRKKEEEISTEGYVEKVAGEYFTTRKGFSLICEAYAEEFQKLGGKLKFNTELTKVITLNGSCQAVEYQSEGKLIKQECTRFISTIPINLLPNLLEPSPPEEIAQHAHSLRFRGIVFVGILVCRKQVLPASFMYFRDKSFNRVTDLSYFHVDTVPEGATMLIAEITNQPGDEAWNQDERTIQTVIHELLDEGLIFTGEVLESTVYKVKHGYPIYTTGYEGHLRALVDFFGKFSGVHSIGRQGSFSYHNTHVSMKMGYDLARKIEHEQVSYSKNK